MSEREDLLLLAGTALGFGVARMVRTQGPENALTFRGRELPVMCLFRRITGHQCPVCGTSRGLAYMAQLDVKNAFRANFFSPVLAVLVAVKCVSAALRLSIPRSGPVA